MFSSIIAELRNLANLWKTSIVRGVGKVSICFLYRLGIANRIGYIVWTFCVKNITNTANVIDIASNGAFLPGGNPSHVQLLLFISLLMSATSNLWYVLFYPNFIDFKVLMCCKLNTRWNRKSIELYVKVYCHFLQFFTCSLVSIDMLILTKTKSKLNSLNIAVIILAYAAW